jgi:hypothetical protein
MIMKCRQATHCDSRISFSSTLFTANLTEIEKWLSEMGSDSGIVTVNTSISGIETEDAS